MSNKDYYDERDEFAYVGIIDKLFSENQLLEPQTLVKPNFENKLRRTSRSRLNFVCVSEHFGM